MRENTEIGMDDRMLGRIIALLLGLAVLAERAAVRSLPVRLLVFWILRRAELAARKLLFPTDAFAADPRVEAAAPSAVRGAGIRPSDLVRLAAGFRAIALLLGRFLARVPDGWRNLHGWQPIPSRAEVAGRRAWRCRETCFRKRAVALEDTS